MHRLKLLSGVATAVSVVCLAGATGMSLIGCSGGGTTYPGSTSGTTSTGTTTATTAGTTTATTTAGTTTATTTTGTTSTTGSGHCASGFFTPIYPNGVASQTSFGARNLTWAKMPITIYFSNDLSITSTDPSQTNPISYKAAVIAGFNSWTTALGSGITYTAVNSSNGADVVVTFTNNPAEGNAVSWSANPINFSGSNLTGETVTFTAQQTGAFLNTTLLQQMGAQAFGSIIGLPSSTNPADVTFPNGTATAPTTEDLNSAKTLYCNLF